MPLNVYEVYPTFQGEVNAFGIGAPVIFLRMAGCPLRCYAKTLGCLCDTPKALERDSGHSMTVEDIVTRIFAISEEMGGVKNICLTGGDPLWQDSHELLRLFTCLKNGGFQVSVETSGFLSWVPYSHLPHITWVIDWKLKSAGIPKSDGRNLLRYDANLRHLCKDDIIKFVIHDEEDYTEFKEAVYLLNKTYSILPQAFSRPQLAAGVYWGGKMSTLQLFELLKRDELLGKVTLNVQLHKLLLLAQGVATPPTFEEVQI